MKQLEQIFETYLDGIGKLDTVIRLGPGKKRRNKEAAMDKNKIEKQSHALTDALGKRFKFNNRIIILAIVLLCILFVIGVVLIFYYRDQPYVMGGIFGGTFLSLLSIIGWLHKLWKEKCFVDIPLSILEGLPPEKAAEFITTIYWKLRNDSKK